MEGAGVQRWDEKLSDDLVWKGHERVNAKPPSEMRKDRHGRQQLKCIGKLNVNINNNLREKLGPYTMLSN